MDDPNSLHEVGVEGTKGLVQLSWYGTENPIFKTPEQIKYYKTWNNPWKTKWKAPYNTRLFEHPVGSLGSYIEQTYWLFSVIERAASAGPGKDHQSLGRGQLSICKREDHEDEGLRPQDHSGPARLRICPTGRAKGVFQHPALLLVQGVFRRWPHLYYPGGQDFTFDGSKAG